MNKTTLWIVIVIIVLIVLGIIFYFSDGIGDGGPAAVTEAGTKVEDVVLVNHIVAGLPEQDVFIVDENDPTQGVRIEGETASDPDVLSQEVFASLEEVEHDPFKLGDNPLGPYLIGESLGFTMGAWLSATGNGTYTTNNGTASVSLAMNNLVPNGVYTVWCSNIVLAPTVSINDTPCGEEDGSENSFSADENGDAEFEVQTNPLSPSTETELSVIALAYHSDGKTNGPVLGKAGLDSHVQLFWILPAEEVMEDENMESMEDGAHDDEMEAMEEKEEE